MQRFSASLIATLIVAGAASAGEIKIGGDNGLTSAYITSGCSTNVGGQSCISGTIPTNWTEQSYDNRLFQTATQGGTLPSPYTGYNMLAAQQGSITGHGSTDTGVVFNMINDGCSTAGVKDSCGGGSTDFSNNFWAPGTSSTSTTATLTIPIGVFDVTDAYFALNNVFGTPTTNTATPFVDTTLTFTFGSLAANQTTGLTVVTLNLTNATNNGTSFGQIRASLECTTAVGSCKNYAGALTSPLASTSTVGGYTVDTNNLYNYAYNSSATGRWQNSTGFVNLDDQHITFGSAFANSYLVSIGVADASGASGTSQTALSAITLESPIPEPSTVMLLLSGLGMIGLGVRRTRRS
jgi:hypothetical protein